MAVVKVDKLSSVALMVQLKMMVSTMIKVKKIYLAASMVNIKMMESMIPKHAFLVVIVIKVQTSCLVALMVKQSYWNLTMWSSLLMAVLNWKMEMMYLVALTTHLKMMDSMILLHFLMSVMITKEIKTCLADLTVEQSYWDLRVR